MKPKTESIAFSEACDRIAEGCDPEEIALDLQQQFVIPLEEAHRIVSQAEAEMDAKEGAVDYDIEAKDEIERRLTEK